MKYIATKNQDEQEEIFIFPDSVDHDAMAEVLGCIKNHTRLPWNRVMREPISAGFVTSGGKCYGNSITLNLKSREEDSFMLERQY